MNIVRSFSITLLFVFMVVFPPAGICQVSQNNPNTYRYDIRALHLQLMKSLGPNYPVRQTKAYVLSTIKKAASLGFNTIILQVSGSIKLRSYPSAATPYAYSIEDVKEMINAARSLNMEVIPEVKFLTKQDNFIGLISKKYMLNERDYDPNDPEVYTIVYRIIDEIIDIFKPRYFHIGHDEVFGVQNRDKLSAKIRNQKTVSANEYLDDTLRIHQYLSKQGIRVMMWADMLLSPKLFNIYSEDEISGYDDYASVVDELPRDIIMCDWHYGRNPGYFPSYTFLQKKGYTVWGAVWKDPVTIRMFSEYLAKWARKGEGIIATTWWPFVIEDDRTINEMLNTVSRAFSK